MPANFNLTGRTALVTGASRGLGETFARALAHAGADVVVTSRTLASLDGICNEIAALGRRAVPVVLDQRERDSIDALMPAALAQVDHVDILVNNAGCNIRKPALEVTWADWATIVDTNLRGAFFVAQTVGRHMVERNYGRIINIGSVTSVFGFAGLAPYGASRGGVKQMTMSLADDWGPHGVTVNCIAPGWFKTFQNQALYADPAWVEYLVDRIPLKRPGAPEDLEGAVVFLASDASTYVTGQTLLVDGGITTGAIKISMKKPE